MRMRHTLVVVSATASLIGAVAGCTSHSKPSTESSGTGARSSVPIGSGTQPPAGSYCARLIAANTTISTAQRALYTGDQKALQTILSALRGLQDGAPGSIKPALADMITTFSAVADAIAHPTTDNRAKLVDGQQRLASDGTKISSYAQDKCK